MVPVIFLYLNISLFYSGGEWWKAFDTDSLTALANTIVGKSLLINVAQRWLVWQTWLPTLAIYEIPY